MKSNKWITGACCGNREYNGKEWEKPEMSEIGTENKTRKTINHDEFIVFLRVKGQRQGIV